MTPNILGVGRQKLEKQNGPTISGNKQGRKFSSDLFFTATKLRPLTHSVAKRLLESVEAVAETTTKSVMLFLQNRISQRDSANQKHSFFSFFFSSVLLKSLRESRNSSRTSAVEVPVA